MIYNENNKKIDVVISRHMISVEWFICESIWTNQLTSFKADW